jgi:hypothetical protein
LQQAETNLEEVNWRIFVQEEFGNDVGLALFQDEADTCEMVRISGSRPFAALSAI